MLRAVKDCLVGRLAEGGLILVGDDSVAVCGDLGAGRTLVRVITHGDPDQRPVTGLGAVLRRTSTGARHSPGLRRTTRLRDGHM